MLAVLLLPAACALTLPPLGARSIAREVALNEARHAADLARSAATWGPPLVVGDCAGDAEPWPVAAVAGGHAVVRAPPGRCGAAAAAAAAEEAGARWRGGAPANSRFTMVDGLRDAHVEDLPRTKRWLLGLLRKSLKQMAAGAGVEASRLAVYDALVVRYGGAGSGQPVHRDYGELTLNVALNDGTAYAGGGTRLEPTGETVRNPEAGGGVAHASALRHAGAALAGGARYVLVCFLVDADGGDAGRLFHARAAEAHRRGRRAAALRASRAGLSLGAGAPGELHKTAGLAARALADAAARRGGPARARVAARLAAAAEDHLAAAAAHLPRSVAALGARADLAVHAAATADDARAALALARAARDAAVAPAERDGAAACVALAERTLAFLASRERRPVGVA